MNVGPTAEGLIPEPSVERLNEIGGWMQKNGESIYGTSASPFFKLPWGRCTTKKTDSGNLLYLHVFDWPKDGVLRVPGLDARIKDVYLLTNKKQKFSYKFEKEDLLIHAPTVIFDPINTVVVVKTGKRMEITSNMPSLKEGKILMPADFADIHNPGYGTHAVLSGSGTESVIQNWVDYRARLEWMFNAAETGRYKIEALIKSDKTNKLNIKVGDENLEAEIPSTNEKFEILNLGEIEISEPGDKIISLTPVQDNWANVELMYVELVKI